MGSVRRIDGAAGAPPHAEDMVSVERAAAIAGCSTRTIRRAYRAGRLAAYRDGNGHAIRIRYGDLREWMMASPAAAPSSEGSDPGEPPPVPRLDMAGRRPPKQPGKNVARLNAARARLRRAGAGGA